RRQGMTAAAIDARGLGRDFGAIRALDALDLEVREAEFFGLLGPNGAGKTTTVHLLATLLRPTRGTARVAGYDVVREDLETRRRIGLVFQETTLDRDLTVEQNLRFAARLWNLPGRSMRAIAGIVVRELLRFLRQRGRLLSSLARPFVWLVFAGAGFATVFSGAGAIDYRRYLAPGLLGMAVMFGSLLAALSTVID